MYELKIVRVYDLLKEDMPGYRILVDRIWPRGVKKADLKLDFWEKDLAPSADLRKWFDHREDRFEEFSKAYRKELDQSSYALGFSEELRASLEEKDVLLLYAAKSETINHARVLKGWLEEKLEGSE